jgi:hypothetical protein
MTQIERQVVAARHAQAVVLSGRAESRGNFARDVDGSVDRVEPQAFDGGDWGRPPRNQEAVSLEEAVR